MIIVEFQKENTWKKMFPIPNKVHAIPFPLTLIRA